MEDHIHSSWCLLVSTCLLAAAAVSANILRSIIRSKFSPSLPVLALLDFLCGLELCVCGFELGVVLDIYGIPLYSAFLWLVVFWQGISWGEATANPGSHFLSWFDGRIGALEGITRSLAAALGGLSSLLVLAPLWALELSHLHQGRAGRSSSGNCGEDLQVSVPLGCLVELAGCLVSGLSASWFSDSPSFKERPLLASALDSALAVGLVIAAFDITGGYFSPVLALGIKLGCGTNDLTQYVSHLIVYWVGPCIAALLARPVYARVIGNVAPGGENVAPGIGKEGKKKEE